MEKLYRMIRLCAYAVLLWGLVGSCITPFEPEVPGFGSLLVIEGRMQPGRIPAEVIITRTFDLDEQAPTYETGARVVIEREDGVRYICEEKAPGIYKSDVNQLIPTAGTSYRLDVRTRNDVTYQSDWQVQKKATPIGSLEAFFEERASGFDTLQGMQVYVSTNDPEGLTRFYRYEYEETWLFSVAYPSRGDWDIATNSYTFYENDSIPVTCYGNFKSSEILLKSTAGLELDQIIRFPLRYVTTETPKLNRRYSILVRQYSLNEDIYRFWQSAEQLTENLGSLFDPIPANVIGNIKRLDESDEVVLGYFSAEGVSETRIFIDRSDFSPRVSVPNGKGNCELIQFNTANELSTYVAQGGNFVGVNTDFFGNVLGYTGSTPFCSDCRLRGTLKKPDFWR